MNMKLLSAFIPCIIFAFSATAAGDIPAIIASVFSGGSWLRANDDNWSSGKSKSSIRQLAEDAQRGDVDAMRQLGVMSMKGQKVKKSARIAIQWWKKAADRGDGRSMVYLGDVYSSGNGVHKDEQQALRYYENALKSAGKEGEEVADDDNIVIKRIKKLPLDTTIAWWKKRCSKGDVHAMYYLGTLKKKSREGVLDDKKTADFLIQAAISGHPKAIRKIEKAPKEQYLAYWKARETIVPSFRKDRKVSRDSKAEIRESLAKEGITPDKYNEFMFGAYAYKDYALVDLLLKAGADPEATNRKGSTLLQKAAYDGNVYIAECLLSKGASSKGTGKMGMPPLVVAICSDSPNPRMVQLLLETGADPSDLAITQAITKKNALIVRLLLKAGAESQGIHLLMAVNVGHAGIVRQLLQAGADVNFRDSKNKTALGIAVEKGYAEIADILKKSGAR